jgi:hypothetical protein
MISINDLRNIKQFVIEDHLMNDVEIVSDEQQLPKIISRMKEKLLIIVIPSADSNSPNVDDITEESDMLMFFISKMNALSNDHESFLDLMEDMQEVLLDVKHQFVEAVEDCNHELHYLFKNYQPVYHIDPEYDLHGCHGWSLSFKL